MKGIIVILAIISLGVLYVGGPAPLQAQPTLMASSADSLQRQDRLAYEVKWCCECIRGGIHKESLGWMEEQRCYLHGGWCGGPRRRCNE